MKGLKHIFFCLLIIICTIASFSQNIILKGGLNISGIDETEASDFEIYPTLTSDKVFISYDKVLGEKVKLSVFYQNGQLFHDYTLITPFSTNISLENCPTGIYIIAIYGNGFNIKKKVVKI
jgi:hypothetical protein